MLMWAAFHGRADYIGLLMDYRAKADLRDNSMATALMYACDGAFFASCKMLVDRDAALDLQSKDRLTALMCASRRGCADCVRYLVEKGARMDLTDSDSWTALHVAAHGGFDLCVEIMVRGWLAEKSTRVVKPNCSLETPETAGFAKDGKTYVGPRADLEARNNVSE